MKIKFLIILLIILFFGLSSVSASDLNDTGCVEIDYNQTAIDSTDFEEDDLTNSSGNDVDDVIVKENPKITLKTNKVKSKDNLIIYLKNSSGSPLISKNLSVSINNKKYSVVTNSKGLASLRIALPAKTYVASISFKGDEQYNSLTKKFNVVVSKSDTKLIPYANYLVKGKSLYIDLKSKNNLLSSRQISITIKGKTFTRTTNNNGRAEFKMNLAPALYSVVLKYGGNGYYKSCTKKVYVRVTGYSSIVIGNSKLLTNGYLRIYLKDYSSSKIYHKTLVIKVGDKKFTKRTNDEGVIVFKPKAGAGQHKVTVKYNSYFTSKKIKCIQGDVKDPLKEEIGLKNGVPDIDVMPGNYIMGDGSATYTLTKDQYREVIKRDSYCLYLNNKLSKYTFFKTKNHPNTNHIIKREKWNVIERALNTAMVKANNNKWPDHIKVSLKGKQYNYPEVRDPQNTDYTCGPTSASVCSQVLRNYLSEKHIAKKAKSKPVVGTTCYWIMYGLGDNFNCTYFYKNSFDTALKELKKGDCALIFHTKNHYVSILDISDNGKYVLVSNSYGQFYNIPSKWLSVSYMKTRFVPVYDDGLIVKLNYNLSNATQSEVNYFYNNMGTNWHRHNTAQTMGFI